MATAIQDALAELPITLPACDERKMPIYVIFPFVRLDQLPAIVQAEMPLKVEWEELRQCWHEDKDCWWVRTNAHPPSIGIPWVPRDVMIAPKGTPHPGVEWDWAVTQRYSGIEVELYVRKNANW